MRKQMRNISNDIGTEELAHLEMVGTMVKQLTKNASIEEIEKSGLAPYYADHDKAVYPVSAAGVPLLRLTSSRRATPLRTLRKTWQRSRKPARPMNT